MLQALMAAEGEGPIAAKAAASVRGPLTPSRNELGVLAEQRALQDV